MPVILPHGSWPSPITAASLVEGSRDLGSLQFDGGYLYWLESRPQEGGRTTIMRWREGGLPEELLPPPWNVRTRVQEYGGGSLLVAAGSIWFSNYQDQRLYCLLPGGDPVALTPAENLRYAGCVLDSRRGRLLCIREDHRGEGEPRNALVALPLGRSGEGEVLFDDADFVSSPSLSPDGERVAFTSWRHPNMPWDNTSLWSATFDGAGRLADLVGHNPGSGESVINPRWDGQGALYAISDRDNWWQLYRVEGRRFTPLYSEQGEAEIGGPDWSIATNYYHPLDDGRVLAKRTHRGVESLVLIDPARDSMTPLPLAGVAFPDFMTVGDRVFAIATTADSPPALITAKLAGKPSPVVIRTASDKGLESDWVPAYRLVRFPVGASAEAHGIYLPPANPGVRGPEGEAPPLLVTLHGGPTGMSDPGYDPGLYYWTSRGFAVLQVNYRGSTGYGREYRRALYGQWGVFDVEDAVAGAQWLAAQGLADPKRLIIRGGSAGGFSTLATLAFQDTFAAGASYYGISDIEALARDTHKFESRYLDQVIGPYPEARDLYRARSPIHHLQGFDAPLILLQGLDDPVVPPSQSEAIFEALRSRGVATAYVAFEGESHGFRKAENRIRALESELYFYSRVLGFDTADTLPQIDISNLPSRGGEKEGP
jgi:dipeptidyl aminopeptidase/acylaminoacyl peptidase